MKSINSLRLLLTRLLVGGELSVAPTLVLRFLVGLLHELHNQVLYHLLHLLEWIISHTHGKGRERPAVDPRGLALQVCGNTQLVWVLLHRPQLCKRGALGLHQGWEMLLRSTRDCTT